MSKPTRTLTLEAWLDEIKSSAEQAAAAKTAQPGACLRPNPQTGGTDCIFTDPDTCKSIGGTFLGGPCGPISKTPDSVGNK
jgi:hypothetical protein